MIHAFRIPARTDYIKLPCVTRPAADCYAPADLDSRRAEVADILNRPILLLDEPTANVDPESEAIIASALSRMRDRRTSLAITHRLSLFDHAGVVYRLEEGQIVRQAAGLRLVSRQGAHGV
jgi:ABC-type transport system involved in cytochrome bd biosynthesis fused ATPase/permease subunit